VTLGLNSGNGTRKIQAFLVPGFFRGVGSTAYLRSRGGGGGEDYMVECPRISRPASLISSRSWFSKLREGQGCRQLGLSHVVVLVRLLGYPAVYGNEDDAKVCGYAETRF